MASCIPPLPPPYTSVPDYVWARYRHVQRKPVENIPITEHPSAETALKAAKLAAKEKPNRYYGRWQSPDGRIGFNVYENGKVIVRHVASH